MYDVEVVPGERVGSKFTDYRDALRVASNVFFYRLDGLEGAVMLGPCRLVVRVRRGQVVLATFEADVRLPDKVVKQ